MLCEEIRGPGAGSCADGYKRSIGSSAASNSRGLCANCAENPVCKLPGCNREVMFCEEYRLEVRCHRAPGRPHGNLTNALVSRAGNMLPGWSF